MTVIEIALFSKFDDDQQMFKFFHYCVSSLSPASLDSLQRQKWDKQEFEPLKKLVHEFYQHRILDDSFPMPSELPQRAQNVLEAAFKICKKDIINAMATNQLITNGHNLVLSFDWKLKWILGSSKLDSINEPICQVDLNCSKLGEDLIKAKKSIVNFECNLEKLDELIAELSKAKDEFKKVVS